jgi:hypothetical protein
MAKIKGKDDTQPWRVEILKKTEKQIAKLPTQPVDILSNFFALNASLELNGPEQPDFENYGKLKNKPKGEECTIATLIVRSRICCPHTSLFGTYIGTRESWR